MNVIINETCSCGIVRLDGGGGLGMIETLQKMADGYGHACIVVDPCYFGLCC